MNNTTQKGTEGISKVAQLLIDIGFNNLESEIYLFLLAKGISTGYAISKGISKPVANVYKAMDTLALKGAVEYSQSEKKLYVAMPWEDFLSKQKINFNEKIALLTKEFKSLPNQDNDENIYQISNVDQVISRCIKIIDSANTIILADIEPDAFTILQNPLLAAAKRGVEVWVKAYEPIELEGVNVVLRRNGEEIYKKTPDIMFSVSVDGEEFILASLSESKNRVIQAFRSNSALMNLTIHTQILYGIILSDLKQQIPARDIEQSIETLRKTNHLHPVSTSNSVFTTLQNRYHP